jgi:methylglyoxal synthase
MTRNKNDGFVKRVYNIPIACNRSSADFIISSPLINEVYEPKLKDDSEYLKREVD